MSETTRRKNLNALAQRMQAAAIPKRYTHCSLSTFYDRGTISLRNGKNRASEFSNCWPTVDRGLLLMGPCGSGKTHLAVAITRYARQLRNDVIGKRIRVTEICPGRVETEIFGRNLGGTPEALQEAWHTYYEGFESITTADVADTIEFALDAPGHVNLGLIEILPTFQVPGGLEFVRRTD